MSQSRAFTTKNNFFQIKTINKLNQQLLQSNYSTCHIKFHQKNKQISNTNNKIITDTVQKEKKHNDNKEEHLPKFSWIREIYEQLSFEIVCSILFALLSAFCYWLWNIYKK